MHHGPFDLFNFLKFAPTVKKKRKKENDISMIIKQHLEVERYHVKKKKKIL